MRQQDSRTKSHPDEAEPQGNANLRQGSLEAKGDTGVAIAEGAHEPEKMDLVKSSLLKMEESDRLLMILWYAEGMTPEEIGMVLDTTDKEVRLRHAAVLAQLDGAVASAA